MNEIAKPAERTYWIARNATGDVLHVGFTDPSQVTTSGQSVFATCSKPEQVEIISQYRDSPAAWNYEWTGEQWEWSGDDAIYIPAAPETAEALSRALFQLIYGRDDGLYARVITHASGQLPPLLQVRATDTVPVSLAADIQPLVDVLQIAADGGRMTQAEVDAIAALGTSLAGREVEIMAFVPQSVLPHVMDRETVQRLGYQL